ncbi:DUF3099 domain-containing protein [Streptomyces platensis]|uniref:DUF3099 domain-containing protein n=1 Tax=Streptomyces platensis TaxID=58346 RepID=A0AAE6TLX1_STRPT|nr:DUF3099 domain-containing protein [Streptomyces platensis]OSY39758.1 hypothetical protein BG653_05678 [Streptomyces platensis]QEV51795.1 DUF3099 domain-containing protein [Streptomyces platensis]BCK72103.1 membrane protein [Streptomyces libani subsp. rufus]
MRKQSSGQTFRITGARQGLSEDVRGRQRRYVISMAVRTVAVVLTVVLWNIERPVAIATLVLGLALPYIAVVIANAGRENAPSLPKTFVAGPTRTMLPPGASDTPAESVPERPAAGASGPQHDPS